MKSLSLAVASFASLALVACGSNSINTNGTTGGGSTTTGGAATTTGSGTTTGASAPDYPVVPQNQYGVAVGQTFPDICLAGGALMNFSTAAVLDCPPNDSCSTGAANWTSQFCFDQLYAQGKAAPVGGGFRYAFIDISGAWCIHCQGEAGTLPSQYVANWLAEGGVVFSILVQGETSASADTTTLFDWISNYQINYPMSLDTNQDMATSTGLKAWPGNLIIRLSDMKVMASVLGATDQFYKTFSGTLTQCLGDDTLPNNCWAGTSCNSSGVCQ